MAGEPKVIDVAKDFSATPGGRYRKESEWSGQQFREDLLAPALANGGEVVVDLDGPEGLTTSFLDEVFGEIVRQHGFKVMDRLHIRAIRRPTRALRAREIAQRAAQEQSA